MAKTKNATQDEDEPAQQTDVPDNSTMADVVLTEARVLVDCRYGRCNTIVMLDAETVRQGIAENYLDANPTSIAYLKAAACPATS